MIDLGSDRLVVRLLVAIVMASAIFTFWPGIDLFVSGWFFDEEHGFWLSDLWLIKIVREAIYALMAATLVGALAFAIMGLLGFRPWGVPPNLWGFIAAYFLVGPLWFANVVLKNRRL